MQPIRLIALDMDGTLLTRSGSGDTQVPAANLSALMRCQEAGIHIVLASGRLPDDAALFVTPHGIKPHIIGLNGSVILDEPYAAPAMQRLLPEDTALRVFRILQAADVDIAVFTLWDACSVRPNALAWARRELGTHFGNPAGRVNYFTGMPQALDCMSRAGKIVALAPEHSAALADARRRIASLCPEVSISSSWSNNFEVNPAGVDKGSALSQLAARLGIPLRQTMAIGDNDNDGSMLRAAGVGVAMGNANASAVAAATHITLPCGSNGVAAAINALVFGEEHPGVRAR